MRHVTRNALFTVLTASALSACSGQDVSSDESYIQSSCSHLAGIESAVDGPLAPADAAALLAELVALNGCTPAALERAEQLLIVLIERLNDGGQLRPTLEILLGEAQQRGLLTQVPEDGLADTVTQLVGMIDAELCLRGRAAGCESNADTYRNWEQLAEEHLTMVRQASPVPGPPGTASLLADDDYLASLEVMSGSPFVAEGQVELLVDGPASFAVRDQLIERAESSIHLMSWAIYGDDTGYETARRLVARAAEGIDVRVIVDEQVSYLTHLGEPVTEILEAEGSRVQVIRWRDPRRVRQHDGTHRKLMVVDGVQAVAGGMNVGDVYSHRGGEGTSKWRDTDVTFCGPAAAEASKLFAAIWNDQIARRPELGATALDLDSPTDAIACTLEDADEGRIAVTNHTAGDDAHGLLATLEAISGATTTIDLEHSYFIVTPDVEQVLLEALERGVRVRLLTNSLESLGPDDAVLGEPILASLPRLLDAGAEIYLRRGSQLHSKFLTIDGVYSAVGSYNLHPRSHRYEGELIVQVLGADFADAVQDVFEADITPEHAERVESSDDLQVPKSTLATLTRRWFFDEL